jgi:hypothetical protein
VAKEKSKVKANTGTTPKEIIQMSSVILRMLIIFEIHHIDENRSNNEFINLLMVCPTCHSKLLKIILLKMQ